MSSSPTSRTDANHVVIVGKLGRPYGVRGWQVLHSFTEPAENLLSYAPWLVQSAPGQPWIEVKGYQSRPHKEATGWALALNLRNGLLSWLSKHVSKALGQLRKLSRGARRAA